MAQWIGQRGSEAVRLGSNLSLYLHFLTVLIRRKIVIPSPLLCMKKFDTGFFLKSRRVPLRKFSVL